MNVPLSGAVTFSKAVWFDFSLVTVEFAIKSLSVFFRFKCFKVLLSQKCRFFGCFFFFYNPPLTKVDFSFLKHNFLYLSLSRLLAASHRNPACTYSTRQGHILSPLWEKFRKAPILISSLLPGGTMVQSSFKFNPCRGRE